MDIGGIRSKFVVFCLCHLWQVVLVSLSNLLWPTKKKKRLFTCATSASPSTGCEIIRAIVIVIVITPLEWLRSHNDLENGEPSTESFLKCLASQCHSDALSNLLCNSADKFNYSQSDNGLDDDWNVERRVKRVHKLCTVRRM